MSHHGERSPLIWIADDSPLEGQLTRSALGPTYEFEHFFDGASVIERLTHSTRLPDVLLLDWVMPAVNGDEVCRFMRQHPTTAELPIIILTASRIETADVVHGLASGANDYLARPFVPEELRARVETLLRAQRLRVQAERERARLATIGKLGRALFDAGPSFTRVIETLATALVESLADGCGIAIVPAATPGITICRHRNSSDEAALAVLGALADPVVHSFESDEHARATLPASCNQLIRSCGVSAFAVIPFPQRGPCTGVVTVMRDRSGAPFEREDLATIVTCMEYASMAFENALRFDAERTARTQLQTIIEQLPIALLVSTREGTVTHVNQQALDLVPGLRHDHSVEHVRRAFTMLDKEGALVAPAERPLERALRGEVVRGVELEIRGEGESARFIRVSAVPLRNALGAIDSAVLAIDDVSDEHAVAAEREQTVRFQQYVLGIVSHDLRTPLQSMMMGAESVKLAALDNAQVQLLGDRLMSATQRMHGIVEQLLDVTRTRLAGGMPFSPSNVELDEIVTRVLEEIETAFPGARLAPILGRVRGFWDADRLAQVVANLVGNAIVHGANGSIEIETRQDNNVATLRVTNPTHGAPLDHDQIAQLFSPFRRTARPKGGSGGLGLGLYIAAEIVRAHNGEIVVEANDATTTFLVRLPVAVMQERAAVH